MMLILLMTMATPLLMNWNLILMSLTFILIITSTTVYFPFSTTFYSPLFFLDLMSSTLILLTVLITILMFMASTKVHKQDTSTFSFLTLILMTFLIISFSSTEMMMFYIFLKPLLSLPF